MTRKRGPAKTETSAMTSCRKEGCCQLSSPQNSDDLCLDPSENRYTGTGSWAGIESFTPETRRGERLVAWLSTPNICTHIPKMFPLLRWKDCKFLSCRILSKQTPGDCPLQPLSRGGSSLTGHHSPPPTSLSDAESDCIWWLGQSSKL